MEVLDAMSRSFDFASDVVAGVRHEQLDTSTPCTEWDVRQLLVHMYGGMQNMGRGARGDALLPDMNAVALPDDIGPAFRVEAERTLAAWKAHGSEGTVDIGAGPMPTYVAMNINLLDATTHAWDLARVTGQQEQIPDELASTVLGVAQGIVSDDLRKFVGIDPAIPAADDATSTDKLVSFLGRKP